MSLREVLLVLHIAGAGIWLGANVIQAMAPAMTAKQGPSAAAGWFRVAARLGNRLYVPNTVLILVTGVFLVLQTDAYGFGSLFVTVGFGMVIIGALFGIFVFEPGSNRAADAIESGDPGRIRSAVSRVATFGTIDTVLLLLTITAMVTRWD